MTNLSLFVFIFHNLLFKNSNCLGIKSLKLLQFPYVTVLTPMKIETFYFYFVNIIIHCKNSLKYSTIPSRDANLFFKNVENFNYEVKLVLTLSNNVEFVPFTECTSFVMFSKLLIYNKTNKVCETLFQATATLRYFENHFLI